MKETLTPQKNDYIDYDRIFPKDPDKIFNEGIITFEIAYPDFYGREVEFLKDAFWDTVRVFKGEYPGYKKCSTKYHDLSHSLSVFLTTARLIHGVLLGGTSIEPIVSIVGLISSLFHDIGLIQTVDDDSGTGAKYTIGHEKRSLEFLQRYLRRKGFNERYIGYCSHIIDCTRLDISVKDINFINPEEELIGKIVGTSDLYTQFSDRIYLEKLFFLYREFQEGGIKDFNNEYELFKNTERFYNEVVLKRLNEDLDGLYKYMKLHFAKRWGMERDFYMEGIQKNIDYLKNVVLKNPRDFKKLLRRAGIVSSLDD